MAIDANLRAEVQAFSTKQGFDATLVESSRQEGVFNGQEVKELDIASMVADAAEEMGFAAAEHVEKKLSERKAGSKEAIKTSATEIAESYINMMAESQANKKLHTFLDSLRNLDKNATEDDIRQLVKEHFKDSSDQYAALSFAEEVFAKEGGKEELLAKLRNVKAKLLEDAGPAIRSGLNIAADVLAYSKQGLESTQGLRDLYRFSILGGQSVSSIYTAIMSRYGSSQFTQSLDFLLRAASSDLDGKVMGSSIEPSQMKNAVDDIFHVQALGNMHRSLSELLDKTRRLYAA